MGAKIFSRSIPSRGQAAAALAIVLALVLIPCLHGPHGPTADDCAACHWLSSSAAPLSAAPGVAIVALLWGRAPAVIAEAPRAPILAADRLARGPPSLLA